MNKPRFTLVFASVNNLLKIAASLQIYMSAGLFHETIQEDPNDQAATRKVGGSPRDLIIRTMIAFIATVLTFSVLIPRLDIVVSDPVDAENPFSSSVTITDSGLLPLKEISMGFALKQVSAYALDGSTVTIKGDDFRSVLHRDSWVCPYLTMDDRLTVALNDVLTVPEHRLRSANIAIIVNYRIPIINLKFSKLFPIYAKRQSNGQFYWYSYSKVA